MQLEAKTNKEAVSKSEAIDVFMKVKSAEENQPFAAIDSKKILKYLRPILALDEKTSDYNTNPKSSARLEKFGRDSNKKIILQTEMKRNIFCMKMWKKHLCSTSIH